MLSGVVEQHHFVVVAAEGLLRDVGDMSGTFFFRRFSSACFATSWLSAAKPTQYGASLRAATVARMSTVGLSAIVSGASCFLILVAETLSGV